MPKGQGSRNKAGSAASRVLRSDRSGKHSKTAAGSALTQKPVTKRALITEAQASKAVRMYLTDRKK
jgi:hypothetical protein